MNYWIFQGNPKAYHFEDAVKKGILNNWVVKTHIRSIKKGDKAIIWLCGDNAGCYGLADIHSNPAVLGKSEDVEELDINNVTGKRLRNEDSDSFRVSIKLTHEMFLHGNFIPKATLRTTTGPLETLRTRGFIQGTNFSANREQFEMILKLIK